jgi:hypothetical protein
LEEAKLGCHVFQPPAKSSRFSSALYTEIGRGMIDYEGILKAVVADPRPLPLSLEIPLRLARAKDASPIRAKAPVELKKIRKVLTNSIEFVRNAIANS